MHSAILFSQVKFWDATHEILKNFVPYLAYFSAVAAVVALWITLRDRRPKLTVRVRQGKWTTWKGEVFAGIVEVYNSSSRPNTIRAYHLSVQQDTGQWTALESERYEDVQEDNTREVFNDTPIIVGPYSGLPVKIAAFGRWQMFPRDLQIKVLIEDLFGNKYSANLSATNKWVKP